MVKTMKHADDVELSSEELMAQMNEGNTASLDGATIRASQLAFDQAPLTPFGEREAERAAGQAMEEIRQANIAATRGLFGDPDHNEIMRQRAATKERRAQLDGIVNGSIRATLDSRAKTHGDYSEHATVTQMLKQIMRAAPKWSELSYHEQETLEMVAHKVGRILCGDPHHHDHWHDAAGYFTLSADRNLPK